MKKLVISNKCNGCGLCFINNKYVKENAEGDAEVVQGLYVLDNDLQMMKVISKCPVKAMSLIDSGLNNGDVKQVLKRKLNEYSGLISIMNPTFGNLCSI